MGDRTGCARNEGLCGLPFYPLNVAKARDSAVEGGLFMGNSVEGVCVQRSNFLPGVPARL